MIKVLILLSVGTQDSYGVKIIVNYLCMNILAAQMIRNAVIDAELRSENDNESPQQTAVRKFKVKKRAEGAEIRDYGTGPATRMDELFQLNWDGLKEVDLK